MGMNGEVFQIGLRETEEARVLRLSGELDSFTSERLTTISETWLHGAKRLVVNLDELQYIDSSGLSALVWMWVQAKDNGTQMRITCNNARIHRVLEITGLLNLFVLEPAVAEIPVAKTMMFETPSIKVAATKPPVRTSTRARAA